VHALIILVDETLAYHYASHRQIDMTTAPVQCECCDYFSLSRAQEYLICSVCFWEQDVVGITEPLRPSGANHGLPLIQGRRNFLKFGACSEQFVSNVISNTERGKFRLSPRDLGRFSTNTFSIGSTEFFIDFEKSGFSITQSDSGNSKLTIDIYGANDVFDSLTGESNSDWSWALYPPAFYIHEFPITENVIASDGSLFIATRVEYEFALYMMEHCEVTNLNIRMVSPTEVSISGCVDLWGKEIPFAISYSS
jgi:hypothetical protein